MPSNFLQGFLLFVFISALCLPVFSYAQENLDETCRLLTEPNGCQGMSSVDCRKALENCAKYYEEQSELISQDISKTEKEKKTLQSQISTLKKKIENLSYQIKQGNVMIKDLSLQISDTQLSIDKTSLKIEESKGQLTSIIRTIYEEDQKSITEILFEGNLSNFFDNLVYMESLNTELQSILDDTKELKQYLESQKEKMDEEKESVEKVVKIQSLQKQESEKTKKEQEYLSKLKEAEYQKQLKEKQETEQKAATIRARIWELIGVREAPTYEKAVEVAKYVSGITGIRAAFLLGILTQESNIGKSVGGCYLKDQKTGMGVKFKTSRKWPRVMKPAWVPLFLQTIEELNNEKKLNLDPFATQISCWIPACINQNYHITSNVSVDSDGNIVCPSGYIPFGWGGAMGPAQLMPFNWLGKDNYKEKIEAITKGVADPWDFRDSVLGAALHLKDCRADLSEREAAACYFGGWGNRKNSYHLQSYADPVLALSKCHQQFIDNSSMSAWCEERIF